VIEAFLKSDLVNVCFVQEFVVNGAPKKRRRMIGVCRKPKPGTIGGEVRQGWRLKL
jgi:hypothetical protein